MISFPNAKINLGLYITGKRSDGYHDLESLMIPVPLYDVLEFRKAGEDEFHAEGIPIPGDPQKNLVLRALDIMRSRIPIPPLEIHLFKHIPMGAGLGGGSADGAFMLKMLNEAFHGEMGVAELEQMAGELGSDCPFFIRNRPAIIRGRGDILSPFPFSPVDLHLLLLNPGYPVSTSEAYSGVRISGPDPKLEIILEQNPETWKQSLKNDFETTVFEKYPGIGELKEKLYEHGAVYASMSGSGSSVYGLFREKPDRHAFPEETVLLADKLQSILPEDK